MVVGRTSNFVEGFKSFTADDELMLANLKQALNYSAENLSIPDAKLNLSSNNDDNENNTIRPRRTSPQDPTMNNQSMNNQSMNNQTMNNQTMNNQSMNNQSMNNQSMNNQSMNNQSMNNQSMNNQSMSMETNNMSMPTMSMPTMSINNKSGEGFNNIKKVSSGSQNSTIVYDEDKSNDEEDIILEEEDDNENEETEQSKTRRQHQSKEKIEGFQGSIEIEGRNLKNILLALLLSFIGYLVVYASMNNYIPINDISPQLKKFKYLVYGGIFFIIAYICLEVF
jgi:hypothetical protein